MTKVTIRLHWTGLLLLAAVLVSSTGCGPTVGEISGKVLLDKQPIANVEIVFISTADANQQYYGLSLDDGSYQVDYRTLKGMPVGRYDAKVTRYLQPDGKSLPAGEEGEVMKSSGQAVKVTYVLPIEVARGEHPLDLVLDNAEKEQ